MKPMEMEKFILKYFVDSPQSHIPRDRNLENKIMTASKADYIFQYQFDEELTKKIVDSQNALRSRDRAKIKQRMTLKEIIEEPHLPINVFLPNLYAFLEWKGIKFDTFMQDPSSFIEEWKEVEVSTSRIRALNIHIINNCFPGLCWCIMDNSLNDLVYMSSLTRSEKSKVFLPIIQELEKKIYRYVFPLSSYQKHLFNAEYIKDSDCVIICDYIELAHYNQMIRLRCHNKKIVWCSWYGEDENIKKYDWSILKGKKIYYFLYPHQNMKIYDIMRTAINVKSHLREKNITKDIDFICTTHNILRHISGWRFKVLQSPINDNNIFEYWKSMNSLNQRSSATFRCQKNERVLIKKPFLYSQIGTFIYGTDTSLLSLFIRLYVKSLASSDKFLNGWKNINTENLCVVYFYYPTNDPFQINLDSSDDLFIIPVNHTKGMTLSDFHYEININIEEVFSCIGAKENVVVVLDQVYPTDFSGVITPKAYYKEFVCFFESLKNRGITSILVAKGIEPEKKYSSVRKKNIRSLFRGPFKNQLKISKQISETLTTKMIIQIQSPFIEKGASRNFCCDFKESEQGDTFKVVRDRLKKKSTWMKKPKKKLVSEVLKLRNKRCSLQVISETLKVDISWIKRISGERKKCGDNADAITSNLWGPNRRKRGDGDIKLQNQSIKKLPAPSTSNLTSQIYDTSKTPEKE